MANMVPNLDRLPDPSRSESRIFENIRNGLSDDWTVLHTLNLSDSDDRSLGDIDLILAGARAIHGVSIARSTASWIPWYTKGWLEESSDPFSIASPVRALKNAFVNLLREHVPGLFDKFEPVVGVGFALSNNHPEATRGFGNLVLDIDSSPQGIQGYFDRLTEFWARGPAKIGDIDVSHRHGVVKRLRHVLDRRMSLAEHAELIGRTRIELTQQQYDLFDAFDIDQNPRLLVKGRAGTGKTLCAIDLAKMEASRGKKVLFTCYNRKLEESLQGAVGSESGIKVIRIHDLCRELIQEAGMSSVLSGVPEGDFFRVLSPETAREAVRSLGHHGRYDTLIMDEAQDTITTRYLDLCGDLLNRGIEDGSWAVFYDPDQNIYQGIEDEALVRLKDSKPVILDLSINCRNTIDISRVAGAVSGIDPVTNKAVQGKMPDLKWYKDSREQRDQVSEVIANWLNNGISLDQIVVLSRYTLENSGLKDGLNRSIIDVPLLYWDSKTPERPTDGVVFSTIHNFKGLESEFVVMTDVGNLEGGMRKRLYYVGATRATTALTVSAATEVRPELMKAIMTGQSKDVALEERREISARASRGRTRTGHGYSGSSPGSDALLQRNGPLIRMRDIDTSNTDIQITRSDFSAASYKNNNVLSREVWYGTWGPMAYEVRFIPEQDSMDKVMASARIVGYDGAPTQVQLAIDSDTASQYIFIDGKGECEYPFCPRLDADLVAGAEQLSLVNENGDQISMIRGELGLSSQTE